jgi:tetratricopeptide (TPR) repeat protein
VPDLGFYHPIVIHFAIGLLTGGVLLRALSLIRRGASAGPAAVTMILLATAAIVVAAQSGEDAHVAVEAAPGVASAVRAHQQWGERTRNVALLAAGLEILTLALRGRPIVRTTSFVSAGVGVLAFLCIIETGQLGGELVYGHAGGVGIRSGDPGDVARLFLAGLFRQAEADERAGRPQDAARLLEIAAERFPTDAAIQVLAAEALLEDRKDPQGAIEVLQRLGPIADERLRFRREWLMADALDALGRKPEARAVLERLQAEFPDNARLRGRLARADANTTIKTNQ